MPPIESTIAVDAGVSARRAPADMAWRLGWQKWARGDSRPFSRRTEVRAWLRELGILQRDSDTP